MDIVSPSDARAARAILDLMALAPPTLVTGIQLLELASLCLCNHHKDQYEQVAAKLGARFNMVVTPHHRITGTTGIRLQAPSWSGIDASFDVRMNW